MKTVVVSMAALVAVVTDAEGDSVAVIAEGDGDGDPDVTVVTIPDAGDNCAAGSYTIVDGDYPQQVADQFDVTVPALTAANSRTSGYNSFYVGLEIIIPAKADC